MGEGVSELMNHLGMNIPFRLFPEAPSPAPIPEPPEVVVQAQPVPDTRVPDIDRILLDQLAAQTATVVELENKVKDLEKQLSIMKEEKETLVVVCYAHQRGECTRGDDCRFSHSTNATAPRSTNARRDLVVENERQRREIEIKYGAGRRRAGGGGGGIRLA